MKTYVYLQDTFSYPIGIIVFLIILLVVISIFILKKGKPKKERPVKSKELNLKDQVKIKKKYIKKLKELDVLFNTEKISIRECFQELSKCIREFVFEITGRDVTKATLAEIKDYNIPNLAELMGEYYEPEFAKESFGDARNAIEKTKRVIEEWN